MTYQGKGTATGDTPVWNSTLGAWISGSPTAQDSETFYVNSDAASGGDGTLAKPFQTVQAALDAAEARAVSFPDTTFTIRIAQTLSSPETIVIPALNLRILGETHQPPGGGFFLPILLSATIDDENVGPGNSHLYIEGIYLNVPLSVTPTAGSPVSSIDITLVDTFASAGVTKTTSTATVTLEHRSTKNRSSTSGTPDIAGNVVVDTFSARALYIAGAVTTANMGRVQDCSIGGSGITITSGYSGTSSGFFNCYMNFAGILGGGFQGDFFSWSSIREFSGQCVGSVVILDGSPVSTVVYVDPSVSGNPNFSRQGSLEDPFPTIQQAIDFIAADNPSASYSPLKNYVVQIAPATYAEALSIHAANIHFKGGFDGAAQTSITGAITLEDGSSLQSGHRLFFEGIAATVASTVTQEARGTYDTLGNSVSSRSVTFKDCVIASFDAGDGADVKLTGIGTSPPYGDSTAGSAARLTTVSESGTAGVTVSGAHFEFVGAVEATAYDRLHHCAIRGSWTIGGPFGDGSGFYDCRFNDVGSPNTFTTSNALRFDGTTQKAWTDISGVISGSGSVVSLEPAPVSGPDEQVKVSANDTTEGYLNGKLVAGTGITLTENNDGSNETLTVVSTVTNTDVAVEVSSNDTTPGDLESKIVAGSDISIATLNDGGNEQLQISAVAPTDLPYTSLLQTGPAKEIKEPAGFPVSGTGSGTTLTLDDGTLEFTIAPSGADYAVWIGGQRLVKSAPETVSYTNVEGKHYFYFDASGVLTHSVDVADFIEAIAGAGATVATIYWNTFSGDFKLVDERHGLMDGETHKRLHIADGAQWISGGSPLDIVFNTDNAGGGIGVSETRIVDEDLYHTAAAVAKPGNFPVYYLIGSEAAPTVRKRAAQPYPGIQPGSVAEWGAGEPRCCYNRLSGGVWDLDDSPSNNIHYIITMCMDGDLDEPLWWVLGTNYYTSAYAARQAAPTELQRVFALRQLFSDETVPLFSIIVNTADFMTGAQMRIVTADGADFLDWRDVGQAGVGFNTPTVADIQMNPSITGYIDWIVAASGYWEQTATSAFNGVAIPLALATGRRVTGASVKLVGAAGHGSLPATQPSVTLQRQALTVGGAKPTVWDTVATVTAAVGSVGAYETIFEVDLAVSHVVEADYAYRLVVAGEQGVGSFAGLALLGASVAVEGS